MSEQKTKLVADVAMSLKGCTDVPRGTWWSGWKNQHWPADLLRRGFQFYGYDKYTKTLFGLIEITQGGTFTYRTRQEFKRKVKRVAGHSLDPSDPHFENLPLPAKGRFCVGYAIRWKRVAPVHIPWPRRFPQLGWERLSKDLGKTPTIDEKTIYREGGRTYRRHLAIERSGKLRLQARDYWREKLDGLRCLACRFSFERRYGALGADFVEMHHLVPLGSSRRRQDNDVRKLVPLCANCHRIVHIRPKEALSMATLKRLLAANSRMYSDARKSGARA
jgi:hypothetical protein